jgi:carbonic anhydrase
MSREGKDLHTDRAIRRESRAMSISRRGLIAGAGAAAGAVALGADAAAAANSEPGAKLPPPRTPQEALGILMRGNRRWVRGQTHLRSFTPKGEKQAEEQNPFAAILTCADSRVSTTLIFDLYVGNVFAARVAGNGIDPEIAGSLEYAVAVLGVKLVMVLGHGNCGAIDAALGVAAGKKSFPADQFGQIGAFVDPLVPVVAGSSSLDAAIATNARFQASALAAMDPILQPSVADGRLMVVPAFYQLRSGRVDLL